MIVYMILFWTVLPIAVTLAIVFLCLWLSGRKKKIEQKTEISYYQDLLYAIGHEGCYALSLVYVASKFLGRTLDNVESVYKGIEEGMIYFNPDDVEDSYNLYVNDAEKFLQLLTSCKWKVTKETTLKAKDYGVSAYVIQEFFYNGLTHFEPVGVKLMKNSVCRENGIVRSLRVCEAVNCLGG